MTQSLQPKKVVTIGVYGFDDKTFIKHLQRSDVRLLVDIRQRRGVRGSQYAWANSLRLQAALADAGIAYQHRIDLAPTTELRQLQYADDAKQGVGKRNRRELAADYIKRFTSEVLDHANLASIVAMLPKRGATALLCVEQDAQACHRHLITKKLAERYGIIAEHLSPPK